MNPAAQPAALDAEELLHLAVIDSQAGTHDSAISKLKQAVTLAPKNAKVQYMLAAEHAEIGLYDRAIEGMAQAVKLDPSLDTAHFQLGLLYYTQGKIQEATKAWDSLDKLGAQHPIFLFKSALISLQAGALEEAASLLEKSRTSDNNNPALARDIERVLANVRTQLNQASNAAPSGKNQRSPAHLLMTKYDDASRDEKQ